MSPFPCPPQNNFFTLQKEHLSYNSISHLFFTMYFHNMYWAHFVWKAIASSLMVKTTDKNSVLASLHALCCNSAATFQSSAYSKIIRQPLPTKEVSSPPSQTLPVPTCTLKSGGTEGETLLGEAVVCTFLCHGETFAVPCKG